MINKFIEVLEKSYFFEDFDKKLVSIFAAGLEYYSFFLFGYFQSYFLPFFLPKEDILNSWWKGFLFYFSFYFFIPLGGIIFGHIGDRIGRKLALEMAIIFSSLTLFLIALLPTYDQAGYFSLTVFCILRFIHSLGIGGETSGIITYILEDAPKKYSGLYMGLFSFGAGIGVLLASFFMFYDKFIDNSLIWFWRLPFLVGVLGLPLVLYISLRFKETNMFLKNVEGEYAELPIILSIKSTRLFDIIGMTILNPVLNLVVFSYIPHIYSVNVGVGNVVGWISNFFALLIYSFSAVVFGYYTTKCLLINELKTVSLLLILVSFPLFLLMGIGNPIVFVFGHLVFGLLCGIYYPLTYLGSLLIAPPYIRYTLVGLGYHISFLTFGGVIGEEIIYYLSNISFYIVSLYISVSSIIVYFTLKFRVKKI